MTRNTSQDPEYEGLPYHEKKLHKTHFGALPLKPQRRKVIGGVLHVWKFGAWRVSPQETLKRTQGVGGNS